jgi:nucleoid-associated protein
MELHQLILHKLDKAQNEVAKLELRKKPYVITDIEKEFISESKEVYYHKSNPNFGIFEENLISYPYQTLVNEYLEGDCDFLRFTSKAMQHFLTVIQQEQQATGGNVIFAHYTVNKEEFLLVMMLNSKKQFNVNEDLGLYDVLILDIEKLDLANTLNITKWKNSEDTYLSFAKGRKEISKYFRHFIGCTDQTSAVQSSKSLKGALLDYIGELKIDNFEKEDIRNKVFNYCVEKIKKREDISLSHISSMIDENNPENFKNFAASERYGVSSLVKGHRQTLKSLKFYVYRSKKLTIEFDSSLVNESIFYNENRNELRIKNIPAELRKQLTNKEDDQ